MRATAEEDRRGDGVATGGVALGPNPAAIAVVSLSFEWAVFSTSFVSLVELAAAVDSYDSLTRSRLAFLLAAFFLAGDLE